MFRPVFSQHLSACLSAHYPCLLNLFVSVILSVAVAPLERPPRDVPSPMYICLFPGLSQLPLFPSLSYHVVYHTVEVGCFYCCRDSPSILDLHSISSPVCGVSNSHLLFCSGPRLHKSHASVSLCQSTSQRAKRVILFHSLLSPRLVDSYPCCY